MEIKAFEIRDSGTFIPAVAIKLTPKNEAERFLLGRTGWRGGNRFLIARLSDYKFYADGEMHELGRGARTMPEAFQYIIKSWDSLESGAVICTEFLRGQRSSPKTSEALDMQNQGLD